MSSKKRLGDDACLADRHNASRVTAGYARLIALTIGFLCLCTLPVAQADSEDFEFWLNPSLAYDFSDETSVELETAQRFRDASNGRSDTYFTRLWLEQRLGSDLNVSGGVERRINEPGNDETRLLQQVSMGHGILRTRLRLEQRFVESADRAGWRLRPRLGVSIPLGGADHWRLNADAEGFVTLRSTNRGGDDGLTGLRTQIGLSVDVCPNLSLSAAYLRQADFVDGGPDEVGHAPIIGVGLSF